MAPPIPRTAPCWLAFGLSLSAFAAPDAPGDVDAEARTELDDAAPAPAPSTPGLPPGLRIGGVIDVYGAWDADMPADHRRPAFLYTYARSSGVAVNLALLQVDYTRDRVRGAVGLMAGTFPQDNQGGEEALLRNVYEARVGVRLHDRVWVDAGVFPSHIGAESAIAPENVSLTRSLTAENSPYYLAGVRLTAELTPTLTLTATGANGWQTIRQPHGAAGFGGGTGLTWAPLEGLTLNWSTWVGLEQPAAELRVFNDVFVVATVGRLELVGLLDVGWQAGSVWLGGNVQTRVRLIDALRLTARGEHFADPEGFVVAPDGRGVRLTGGSFGVDVLPWAADPDVPWTLTWRTEGRLFTADRAVFGAGLGNPRLNLGVTSALALVF